MTGIVWYPIDRRTAVAHLLEHEQKEHDSLCPLPGPTVKTRHVKVTMTTPDGTKTNGVMPIRVSSNLDRTLRLLDEIMWQLRLLHSQYGDSRRIKREFRKWLARADRLKRGRIYVPGHSPRKYRRDLWRRP